MRRFAIIVSCAASLAGCPPGPVPPPSGFDGGRSDSGRIDGGLDGGGADAGLIDGGLDGGRAEIDCAPRHTFLVQEPEVLDAVRVPEYSLDTRQLDPLLFVSGLGWLTPTFNDVHAWRIRYTTQDRGVPAEATALVAVPAFGAASARGTLLWTHPTSGFEDACAPSIGPAEGLLPALVMASRGFVVVAPDYLGLMGGGEPAPAPHPWIVGEPSAIASLDALRAADAWLPGSGEGARIDRSRIVYWGWSEGGFVTLQADRWAPTWAPAYAPVGVVAAVPPVDIRGQVEAGAEERSPATAASALLLYLAADWYREDPSSALRPEVLAALPAELRTSCEGWPSVDGAASADALLQPELLAALRAGEPYEPWTCLLERSSLPSPHVPYTGTAPVLLITAEADTLVPTGPTREAIPGLCAEGYTLQHVDCAGVDHADAPLLTLMRQVGWIEARLRGEAVAPGCGVGVPVSCR